MEHRKCAIIQGDKVKYYILDLTACEGEKYGRVFGDHRKIQLLPGRHAKKWDVVMNSLPTQIRANILKNRREAYQGLKDAEFNEMLKLPLGVDPYYMPKTARIVEVSEEEYAKAHGNDAQTA